MAFGRKKVRATDRTGTPTDLLVVGLGNPGDKYQGSRHNAGADVVRLLADRHGGKLRGGKYNSLVDEVRIGQHRVALAIPLTYYNESGLAVRALAKRHGLPITDADDTSDNPDTAGTSGWKNLVVLHDEMDLDPGRIKLKFGGGLAGNNGLKSIVSHIHTQDFTRIRIGIGKPPGSQSGADHVLRKPGKSEKIEIDIAMQHAADAVESILRDGLEPAMNHYNQS